MPRISGIRWGTEVNRRNERKDTTTVCRLRGRCSKTVTLILSDNVWVLTSHRPGHPKIPHRHCLPRTRYHFFSLPQLRLPLNLISLFFTSR